MAISREDIERIAKAIAERVTSKAQICECGLSMWYAHSALGILSRYINIQQSEPIEEEKATYTSTLNHVAEDCRVDMSEAKRHLGDIIQLSKEDRWSDAFAKQFNLRSAIIDPVHRGSKEEVS